VSSPRSWTEVPLATVGAWGSGGTPRSTEPSYYDGRIPWLRSGDLPDGPVSEHELTISERGLKASSAKWVPQGAVMIAMYGATIGRLGIAAYPVATNQAVAFCIPNKDTVDAQFLFWYLRSIRETLMTLGQGGAQPNINQDILKRQMIALPSLCEQIRVVGVLNQLIGRTAVVRQEITGISRLIAKYRQAVLTAAFDGSLTKHWRAARGLSASWCPVTLGTVVAAFNYGSSKKSAPAGVIPVLRMGNIQRGRLDWSDLVYSSDPVEIDKYSLASGDVLFNRTNSSELVGKTALYAGERPAIFAGYLIRIRCSPRLTPAFLTYLLNSPLGRDHCWRVKADGVSQSNINAKKLAAFAFDLPTVPEQHEIVLRVNMAFEWLDRIAVEQQAATHLLCKLDQAILTRAFRGALAPTNA
jgi:type I restriction enzyme, S subunit